jgi:hypothetical protein
MKYQEKSGGLLKGKLQTLKKEKLAEENARQCGRRSNWFVEHFERSIRPSFFNLEL